MPPLPRISCAITTTPISTGLLRGALRVVAQGCMDATLGGQRGQQATLERPGSPALLRSSRQREHGTLPGRRIQVQPVRDQIVPGAVVHGPPELILQPPRNTR